MIVMIAIGWVVALPMLVVLGLYVASKVLGGRAHDSASIDVTAFAREFVGLADEDRRESEPQRASARRPLGAGY